MSSESDRGSGPEVALIVVLVLAVLVGGLFVLGAGGWLLYRTTAHREAIVQRERALAAEAQARQQLLEVEQVRAQRETEQAEGIAEGAPSGETTGATDLGVSEDALSVVLDREGTIWLESEPTLLDALKGQLEDLSQQRGDAGSVSVVMEVASECPFKYVADVLSICEALGIQNVRFKATDAH
jgi:biopolymer transport protein ExbD